MPRRATTTALNCTYAAPHRGYRTISSPAQTLPSPTEDTRSTDVGSRIAGFLAGRSSYLGSVFAFALLIRVVLVAFLLTQVSSRIIDYNNFGWESWEMGWTARSILLGKGFSSPFLPVTGPTALVPPLYPYLLAGMFHLFGINSIQVGLAVLGFNSLCSALTCIPIYFLGRHSLSERTARIAAFVWAIYPFSLYFSTHRVWDYALTALLFSSSLALAQRLPRRGSWSWACFGALYGITILSNPSITTLLPFLLLIAMYQLWRRRGPWLRNALLAVLTCVAVCTPWQIRNYRVMHATFFMRDGFWLEFYAGNNGDTFESNSGFVHPATNPREMRRFQDLGEIRYMAEKQALSVSFVTHQPAFFAWLCIRRAIMFWIGFWSFSRTYLKFEPFDLPNVPFCLFLLVCTVRGLRRWWAQDRSAALPYLIAVLVFPIPYYLTHASMDYRQPLEPVIVVLVTVGLFGTGLAPVSRRNEIAADAVRGNSIAQL